MKNLLILLTIVMSISVSAQSSKVVSAYNNLEYYRNDQKVDDLLKAKEAIDEATGHEKTKVLAKTWRYNGLVYMELSRLKDMPDLSNGAAEIAFDSIKKSISLDEKGKFTKDNANSLYLMTSALYDNGSTKYAAKEYVSAYGYFMKVLEIYELTSEGKEVKVDTVALWAAAVSADGGGMKEEAIALYTRLIDMNYQGQNEDDGPAIYQSLAKIHREAGDDEKASSIIKSGMEKHPNNKNLIIDEINYLLNKGMQVEAQQKMEEAIQLDPENATLHFALGTAYDSQMSYDKAIDSYNSAIKHNPNYFDAYYNLGAVYYNQAAQKTKEMNELDLNDNVGYDLLKGESEALFESALPFLEKAHEIAPEDTNAILALKEIYARQNKFDKVKEMKALLGE